MKKNVIKRETGVMHELLNAAWNIFEFNDPITDTSETRQGHNIEFLPDDEKWLVDLTTMTFDRFRLMYFMSPNTSKFPSLIADASLRTIYTTYQITTVNEKACYNQLKQQAEKRNSSVEAIMYAGVYSSLVDLTSLHALLIMRASLHITAITNDLRLRNDSRISSKGYKLYDLEGFNKARTAVRKTISIS